MEEISGGKNDITLKKESVLKNKESLLWEKKTFMCSY